MKRSRISRVMQILTTLQAGKSYTVSDLSKMFRTSRRTIFRDLKELQAIGVPYRYDTRTSGYTIEPEFFLPPVDLSLQEALGLFLLAYKAWNQIQLPFKNSVLLAALKIENNLPAKIRQYCNTALRNTSIRVGPQALFHERERWCCRYDECGWRYADDTSLAFFARQLAGAARRLLQSQ